MGDEIEDQNVIRVTNLGPLWQARIGPKDKGVAAVGISPINAVNALTLMLHFAGYVFDATPPQAPAGWAPAAAPKPVATPVPPLAPGA